MITTLSLFEPKTNNNPPFRVPLHFTQEGIAYFVSSSGVVPSLASFWQFPAPDVCLCTGYGTHIIKPWLINFDGEIVEGQPHNVLIRTPINSIVHEFTVGTPVGLTVPINTFYIGGEDTYYSDDGIMTSRPVKFMVTETPDQPLPDDPRWILRARANWTAPIRNSPSSYTTTTYGMKSLYPWGLYVIEVDDLGVVSHLFGNPPQVNFVEE